MTPLSHVLGGALSDGQQKKLRCHQVLRQWNRLVGPQIARATRPRTVRGKTLYVTTRTAAWANELSLLKPKIMRRLNQAVGETVIGDIVFRTGRLERLRSDQEREGRSQRTVQGDSPFEKGRLTPPERALLASLLPQTEDTQLRRALRRCAEDLMHLRRARRKSGWRECALCHRQNPPASDRCTKCRRPLVLRQSGAPPTIP